MQPLTWIRGLWALFIACQRAGLGGKTLKALPINTSVANNYISYTGDNLIADVSYDAFFAWDPTAPTPDFEVMVWLATFGGAQPIGFDNNSPIASYNIDGVEWNLYKGTSGWTVFSFVATTQQNTFNGNMMDFFDILIGNQGFPSSIYMQFIQAGTEAFTGSNAWFTTSPYSISISF
jgi:xyloglucan-specific endo-beta-1,4-glucanase